MWRVGKKGGKEWQDSVIIQAKGRINPDGPLPLLFFEDGSARNRAMPVTLFYAVLLPSLFPQAHPCTPQGKAR